MDTKDTDYVESVFLASTHDYLLCLTEAGRLYWIKAYDLPEGGRAARGKAIVNLLEVSETEKLAAMLRVRKFSEDEFLVMATANGVVKKTCLAEYGNPRAGGIIAINIDETGRCELFDSYGFPPNFYGREFVNFLTQINGFERMWINTPEAIPTFQLRTLPQGTGLWPAG